LRLRIVVVVIVLDCSTGGRDTCRYQGIEFLLAPNADLVDSAGGPAFPDWPQKTQKHAFRLNALQSGNGNPERHIQWSDFSFGGHY
jgi:hypothetical protein